MNGCSVREQSRIGRASLARSDLVCGEHIDDATVNVRILVEHQLIESDSQVLQLTDWLYSLFRA